MSEKDLHKLKVELIRIQLLEFFSGVWFGWYKRSHLECSRQQPVDWKAFRTKKASSPNPCIALLLFPVVGEQCG
jgi:hypothetical protein